MNTINHLLKATLMALSFSIMFSANLVHADDVILISQFNEQGLDGWEQKDFEGSVLYSIVDDEGDQVLKALADKSSAGLIFEKDVDITQTPYLNWQWKVQNMPNTQDELNKQNDDFAARVYVIFKSKSLQIWPDSLNYVWSKSQPKNTHWQSPYTDKVALLSLRNEADGLNEWHTEKVNVLEDIKSLFGLEIEQIQAIAIMSDSDNTESLSTAYYRNLFFSVK